MEASEAEAILKWINTFELESECFALSDLCDGVAIANILREIAPEHFGISHINKNCGENWALKANNFKQILRFLGDYYKNELRKNVDMSAVDANAIARTNSEDDLIDLLELVVGCAVLCADKATFIKAIFSLDVTAQSVLKGMIERVMTRVSDVDGGEYEEEEEKDEEALSAAQRAAAEDNMMLQDMVRTLQSEKLSLLSNIDHMEKQNRQLQEAVESLNAQMNRHDDRREAAEDHDRSRAAAAVSANRALEVEIDDVRNELERVTQELRTARSELAASAVRLNVSEEAKARLEVEAQQMADELDVAKDKAAKLSKAENTIEKYKRKMEEMNELQKQNRDLENELDKRLDQIQELETNVRAIETMKKLVEQYKDKAVELEREKIETISALQMKDVELKRAITDLESMTEARRFLEEELSSARAELETDGDGDGNIHNLLESAAALKEQNKRLERELKVAKHSSSGAGGGDVAKLRDDIALLQAELEDTKNAKKEREETLFATKRSLAEITLEYEKLSKQLQESEGLGGGMSSAAAKEAEQQLSQRANTIRMLEDRLKEKETTINKLEQDKMKLETFAKKTVAGFKEKYMNVLHRITAEKKTLEGRLQAVISKNEKNQETHRREERLLLSSMYEIGVRIMDRNIQCQVQESSEVPATVLSAQRAEQDRKQLSSMMQPSAPASSR